MSGARQFNANSFDAKRKKNTVKNKRKWSSFCNRCELFLLWVIYRHVPTTWLLFFFFFNSITFGSNWNENDEPVRVYANHETRLKTEYAISAGSFLANDVFFFSTSSSSLLSLMSFLVVVVVVVCVARVDSSRYQLIWYTRVNTQTRWANVFCPMEIGNPVRKSGFDLNCLQFSFRFIIIIIEWNGIGMNHGTTNDLVGGVNWLRLYLYCWLVGWI